MLKIKRPSLAATICGAGFGVLLVLQGGPAVAAEQKLDASPKAPVAQSSHPVSKAKAPASEAVSETVITATQRLVLDAKGYEATFVGDVKVLDQRFSLNCDKLVAFLKRPPEPGKATAETPADKKKPAAENPNPGSGVEKAVAEGDVVIVQDKVNDRGEIERSIGRAARAVYEAASGDITLSGWPQVEQRMNTVVATDERTVIILNNKGTMEVLGHSKSVLRSTKTENGR